MEVIISKSKKPDKKYDAWVDGSKTVSFGQKGASDFTKHKDKDRKEAYIARHKKNEGAELWPPPSYTFQQPLIRSIRLG